MDARLSLGVYPPSVSGESQCPGWSPTYSGHDGRAARPPRPAGVLVVAVMGVGAMGGALATRGRERGALLFVAGTVVGAEKFTRCARLQLPSFVIGERYASAGRSSALDSTTRTLDLRALRCWSTALTN